MLAFMIRMLVVGGIVSAAAYCFERALRYAGFQARHAWTLGLLLSLVLPFVPRLTHVPQMPAFVPSIALSLGPVSAAPESNGASVDVALLLYVILSGAVAIAYGLAWLRLRAARRGWRAGSLAGQSVFVSVQHGPAVFGFARPRIVVPEWTLSASPEEQRLIVLHEQEHIRARDHLLVLLSMLAALCAPWNPFIWLQARRLRFAAEVDCDQRVLARAGDRERYASLLVDACSRQSSLTLTPALAEQRHGLEKRIALLTANVLSNRWRAALFLGLAAALVVVACQERLPTAPVPMSTERTGVAVPTGRGTFVEGLRFGEREYPPALRAAGIGGTVGLKIHVTDGGVCDEAIVTRSSGNKQLDEAAIKAVKNGQWGNEGPARHTDYWTTTSVTFDPRPRTETASNVDREPVFTPYTKQPELQNREEVVQALKENYPPLLRNAGIGGQTPVWVLIDESGKVVKAQTRTSSGHEALDRAAERVAALMKFAPALNRDVPVKVWIQLPIVFRTADETARSAVKLVPSRSGAPLDAKPAFSPYTVRPELQNREEVSRALMANYPPALRDAGIGGQIMVWVLIDAAGKVVKAQIKDRSGHEALDRAAEKVAQSMKFSPARSRDEPVKVWILLPIAFKTK